jgi:hypothetical protein
MGLFEDLLGPDDPPDHDPTSFAYNTSWSTLRIINLNVQRTNNKKTGAEIPSTEKIDFKAFIKTFRDTFSAGWNETQYVNQSVPIAHQSMPRRTIQLEWTVPASSEKEGILNLQKCSFLAQSMYPSLKYQGRSQKYTPRSTFMAIKFANLIQNNLGGPLPGYISNFTFAPNLEEGAFVAKRNKKFAVNKVGHIIPKVLVISMEFKPIQARTEFGFIENEGESGWADSSWPYDVHMDPTPYPGGDPNTDISETALAPNSKFKDIFKAAEGRMRR